MGTEDGSNDDDDEEEEEEAEDDLRNSPRFRPMVRTSEEKEGDKNKYLENDEKKKRTLRPIRRMVPQTTARERASPQHRSDRFCPGQIKKRGSEWDKV